VADWISRNSNLPFEKHQQPPLIIHLKGKPFRKCREDELLPGYLKAALLEGCAIEWNGTKYGTLKDMIRGDKRAQKYKLPQFSQFDPDTPDQELAEAWADALLRSIKRSRDGIAVGFAIDPAKSTLHNLGADLSTDPRKRLVTMLLAGYDIVLSSGDAKTAKRCSELRDPISLGNLATIREQIRQSKIAEIGANIARREKLEKFNNELAGRNPATMFPEELRKKIQKLYPEWNPQFPPAPQDFDPTLSDQELAEAIADKFLPLYEGQGFLEHSFGRREGQEWPVNEEDMDAREWTIACLLGGLSMMMRGAETGDVLKVFGTLAEIRKAIERSHEEKAS
jgi:hypothetical protein